MTIVYSECVCICVCVCVCVRALGRPLECDSRPAQWQETPWRLWQAASCTPSFGFLSLTHFSSLCYSSTSTYISSSSFCICIHSIHTVPVFFFSFHSSTLCFLSGSQQDLNNWMFLILCFFVYFFLSQSVDESFYLCSGLPHLFFNLTFTHYLVSLLWRQFPLVWPIWSIQPGSAGADL